MSARHVVLTKHSLNCSLETGYYCNNNNHNNNNINNNINFKNNNNNNNKYMVPVQTSHSTNVGLGRTSD